MECKQQILDIELASRRAWPALEESETGIALLRYARGVSRRANCLTPVSPRADQAAALMQQAEQYYWGRGLPAIIRLASYMSAAQSLQARLAACGYQAEAPTAVMLRSLQDFLPVPGPQSALQLDSRQWLLASVTANRSGPENSSLRQCLLDRIADPANYLALTEAGRFVASAMAVHSDEALGLFGIATAPDRQRQGLAASLVSQQLAWGQAQGARYAYLQVEKSNLAAMNLYRKLGFGELYAYCYYVKTPCRKPSIHSLRPESRP
ncbi:MAG: GNAT family N-acetyltransferase [Pseudomonadales bacterium]|nr:GNAT family N-acetyltransferase [Pseudomonadales bacterium]